MRYAIGLDMGITSVGWAVVGLDNEDKPCGIVDMGSRIFDAAEQPKTGASLAAPRREARGMRRRLRRRRHRKERIYNLMLNTGLLTKDELAHLFEGQLSDIYALRVEALDRPVTNTEFARILIHLAQRRGFKSNRKNAATAEDGALLNAVNANKEKMQANGYRTPAEMYLKDASFAEAKRNKGGVYVTTVSRDMTEDEVHRIFAAQRACKVPFATEALENAYVEILLSQRSFDDGPGGNSPYGGSQIEKMIGKCTFEPDEPRAAKATFSFQYFSLLEKINHIRIVKNGVSEPLTDAQRNAVIELAFKSDALTYARIRKELALGDDCRFNVSYPDADVDATEKKEKIDALKSYHQMRKAIEKISKGRFAQVITHEMLNIAGTVLSTYKTSENIRPRLAAAGFEECDVDALEALNFSKFGHLSVKACDKIIPYLEKGMNYNDACTAAGYAFRAHEGTGKTRLLPPLDRDQNEITSPVVLRSVSQTVKVINAIIRKMGVSPVFVHIELAREMSKDFNERKAAERDMKENQKKNAAALERLKTEYGVLNPSGLDLVKFKLWQEQDGVCVYSQKPIKLEKLFSAGYAEVDHIMPYSISFDDGYRNKVLVLAKENRDKGNRLPLEYLTGKRREDYIVWVNANVHDTRKKQHLLKEHFTPEDEKKFKERNLQDTKFASRFMMNYINDNLEFAPFVTGRKKHVTAVNGTVTSYMRKRWGISKIREDGDLHHAVDAVVIACTTDAMIAQVSKYIRYRECQYQQHDELNVLVDASTGEVIKEFPMPWQNFRKELDARTGKNPAQVIDDLKLPFYLLNDEVTVKPLFVSRMPKHKVTGAAHKETVKSIKIIDEGYTLVKKPLTALKLDKSGEIADYYYPESDPLLYDALKAQLVKFGGNAEKAFAGGFRKPKKDGTPGPVVNKVKLMERTTLNVAVQGGTAAADNDSMVRIDVFRVEGDGYYFVPVYVADTLKDVLPNKACVAGKSFAEWKEMDDKDFVFSLYPNDLIRVTHKKQLKLTKIFKESTLDASYEAKSELLYYVSAGISVASIHCISHDNTYEIGGLGIKTLESLEKYTVDVLGEYHPVKKEIRQFFHKK